MASARFTAAPFPGLSTFSLDRTKSGASTVKFDVFGREVEVVRLEDRWVAYYHGAEGKRRPATDIVIPRDLTLAEIPQYLDDLCHEWATPEKPQVRSLD